MICTDPSIKLPQQSATDQATLALLELFKKVLPEEKKLVHANKLSDNSDIRYKIVNSGIHSYNQALKEIKERMG
jgi:hypothetical protein